jgi:hypothetical protein
MKRKLAPMSCLKLQNPSGKKASSATIITSPSKTIELLVD